MNYKRGNNRKRTKGRPKHNMRTITEVRAKEDAYEIKKEKKPLKLNRIGVSIKDIFVKATSKIIFRRKVWTKGQIIKTKEKKININVHKS